MSAIYAELDEAQIQTRNQRDSRPRSVANGFEVQRQFGILFGEYLTPVISNGNDSHLNHATRVSDDYIAPDQPNHMNSVNQWNPHNTFTGGQQQDDNEDWPLPPLPRPHIYMEMR
jgi:hypothetical protein